MFLSLNANAKLPTLTVDPDGHSILLLLSKEALLRNGKVFCVQNVLFFNLSRGRVLCNKKAGDTVFGATATDIPDNFYFTVEEINER